ncbi:hypothetical protein GCM10009836_31780 [Pseudonocardia ailaonensis]|uniref:DUF11 domain-containing protein n=1 Tax=Pseudonocardia ailaonensis TaxID=367279 RepID=A0ABN2N2E9_9PSEU
MRLLRPLAALTAAAVTGGALLLSVGTATAAPGDTVVTNDSLTTCASPATLELCATTLGSGDKPTNGSASVVDSATAQSGASFLRMSTPTATDKVFVREAFADMTLGKLQSLGPISYQTLVEQPSGTAAPSLNIEVKSKKYPFTSVVFEPTYAGAVTTGTWQSWTPSTQGGWWASKDPATPSGQTNQFGFPNYTGTFAQVVDALGADAQVYYVGVNQGTGPAGLVAGVDRLTFGGKTYEFENPVTATTLAATAGTNQTVDVQKPFAPLKATLTGLKNLPVPGADVTFTVTSGSAAFAGKPSATVKTDAQGVATAPTLTSGNIPGPVTVTATSGALGTTFTEKVVASGPVRADVVTTLTVPATAAPGTTFTATLTLTNNGPFTSTGISTALTFQGTGLTVLSAPGGIKSTTSVVYVGTKLDAGRSVSFPVTVQVAKTAKGTVPVQAASAAQVQDPNMLNNIARTSITLK